MLVSYVVFNILNVIIQTIKSIVTIKCNKWVASIVNAVAYGLYTYIVVLTASDIDLWFKIITVALANLVGVFIVKWVEEKKRKDRLWLVKMTIPVKYGEKVMELLKEKNITFTYYDLTKYIVFDCFCQYQKETSEVKKVCELFEGKMFASENKLNY